MATDRIEGQPGSDPIVKQKKVDVRESTLRLGHVIMKQICPFLKLLLFSKQEVCYSFSLSFLLSVNSGGRLDSGLHFRDLQGNVVSGPVLTHTRGLGQTGRFIFQLRQSLLHPSVAKLQ